MNNESVRVFCPIIEDVINPNNCEKCEFSKEGTSIYFKDIKDCTYKTEE